MPTVERKCDIANSFRVLARRRKIKTNTLQGLKGSTLYMIPTDRSGCQGLASSVPGSRDKL